MGMWTIPGQGVTGADLSQERRAFLRDTAEQIVARGWVVPAVTMLEWGKPLASLWGAGFAVGTPFLEGFFRAGTIDHLGSVLGDSSQTEMLLQTIEEVARGKAS